MSPSLPRKKLPIGIQNFAKLREEDCYYVDKTPFACRLAEEGSYYFLSRPRRFGKSLFVDTLKELFEGNKALFKGLHAEEHWDWSKKHPVLRFSFGEGVEDSHASLAANIQEQLENTADRLGVRETSTREGSLSLARVVRAAHEKFGQRVVILVDEYDKPILDYIEQPELAGQMRDTLSLFYSAIKELDPYLKFVLLTGVSKFSKVNLFSKLNNLNDITLDEPYSAICGYTDRDVDTVFAPELIGFEREKIRMWYNGYNWSGESVYNPFDVLLLFQKRVFRPYWYETGNPSFLLKVLRNRPAFLPDLTQTLASYDLLSTFDVENIGTEALLFQTGYLTIQSVKYQGVQQRYLMDYANLEVKTSLLEALMRDWTPHEARASKRMPEAYDLIEANDLDGLRQLLCAFYASIPNEWYKKNPIAQYEGYYASVFYAFFASLGLEVHAEKSSNAGRLDMEVLIDDRALIFEFKVVDDEPEGKALAQILEKGYDRAHRDAGREVTCIGVEFSKEKRHIVGWEMA